jgi:hypothetical protein
VAEGAHPALSKPLGADSSKSGGERRFGVAVTLGWGLGAGRAAGGAWTALAGSGVAGGAAGALIVPCGAGDAGALAFLRVAFLRVAFVRVARLGRACTTGAVAAARPSSAARTRSAGTALSARRGGTTAWRVGAGTAGRGAVRVAVATTA